MQVTRHFFDEVVAVADVDQGPRVRQLRVHEELFYCFRIINRTVSTNSFDLRFVRSYDVVCVASMACPRAVAATAHSLSDAPRRYHGSGPKRPKIGKETTHVIGRWRRVASTA